MGTLEMVVGWVVLSAITLWVFMRVLRRALVRHDSALAVVVAALAVGLLGPGVIVAGHFALAIPVGPGIFITLYDAPPLSLLQWNVTAYGITAAVLLLVGVLLRHRKQKGEGE